MAFQNEIIEGIYLMNEWSILFFKDSQNAIIINARGFVKKLHWEFNANTEDDFKIIEDFEIPDKDISEDPCKKPHIPQTILLINNEKQLMVSFMFSVRIFDLQKKVVIKKFELDFGLSIGIIMIEDDKKAVLLENCDLIIIDLNNLEINQKIENVIGDSFFIKALL